MILNFLIGLVLLYSACHAAPPSLNDQVHAVLMRACAGCGNTQLLNDYKLTISNPDPSAYQITLALMNRESLNPRSSKASIKTLMEKGLIKVSGPGTTPSIITIEGRQAITFLGEESSSDNQTSFPFGLSIILPMYNNLSGTVACISHLTNLISLPKDQWEIIVVDDGCRNADGVWLAETLFKHAPYAQNCRVVWSDKAPGTYRNVGWPRNSGARAATFSHLAFCDSDRYHLTDPATATLEIFKKSPESFVLGQNMILQQSDQHTTIVHEACPTIGEKFEFPSGWIALPRSTFFTLGGYDQRFDCWAPEDSDLIKRLRYYGLDPIYLPSILYVEAHERDKKHRETTQRWEELHAICLHDSSLIRNQNMNWGIVNTTAPYAQKPALLKPRG